MSYDPFTVKSAGPHGRPLTTCVPGFMGSTDRLDAEHIAFEEPTLDDGQEQCRIAIVGDPGVGKTSLAQHFLSDDKEKESSVETKPSFLLQKRIRLQPTSDDNSAAEHKSTTVLITIVDPCSSDTPVDLKSVWLEDVDGVVFVFSTLDRNSFDHLLSWVERVVDASHLGSDVPMVFLENKMDLVDQSAVDSAEVAAAAKQHKLRLYRTSIVGRFNLDEAFQYLIGKAVANRQRQKCSSDEHLAQPDPFSLANMNNSRSSSPVQRNRPPASPRPLTDKYVDGAPIGHQTPDKKEQPSEGGEKVEDDGEQVEKKVAPTKRRTGGVKSSAVKQIGKEKCNIS